MLIQSQPVQQTSGAIWCFVVSAPHTVICMKCGRETWAHSQPCAKSGEQYTVHIYHAWLCCKFVSCGVHPCRNHLQGLLRILFWCVPSTAVDGPCASLHLAVQCTACGFCTRDRHCFWSLSWWVLVQVRAASVPQRDEACIMTVAWCFSVSKGLVGVGVKTFECGLHALFVQHKDEC